ncbi:MAG: glycosyltransferase family 2 protein, partial [Gammaproteobacteria bacterium]|nr:glycosyltransferase family 2 protein [Gammaproteobacteria bacterium]
MTELSLSIVIPARNEAQGLQRILPALKERFPQAEVLVVDDGSTDQSATVCAQHGATCISHPYSMGNGAAIKTGARHARGERIVFMDGDGQHDPEDIPKLVTLLDRGFDMVIGARTQGQQANWRRGLGNRLLNGLASAMTGHRITDLTSGFRAVRAEKFRRFLYLLPNGFSYPTTITMAFFRS